MRKYIIVCLVFFVISLNVHAENSNVESIEDKRTYISTKLNDLVKYLKDIYFKIDTPINSLEYDSLVLKQRAEEFRENTKNKEVNYTVLDHGKADIADCSLKNQTLQWIDDKWDCVDVQVPHECFAPAPDEYMYRNSSGNNICSKSAKGSTLAYYWKFINYKDECNKGNKNYSKIYGCFYTNKLNQVIQVDDVYCTNKPKPYVKEKACFKDLRWQYSKTDEKYRGTCMVYRNGYDYRNGFVRRVCHYHKNDGECWMDRALIHDPECGVRRFELFNNSSPIFNIKLGSPCTKEGQKSVDMISSAYTFMHGHYMFMGVYTAYECLPK